MPDNFTMTRKEYERFQRIEEAAKAFLEATDGECVGGPKARDLWQALDRAVTE